MPQPAIPTPQPSFRRKPESMAALPAYRARAACPARQAGIYGAGSITLIANCASVFRYLNRRSDTQPSFQRPNRHSNTLTVIPAQAGIWGV